MKNLLILTVLLGSLTTFAQNLSLDTGETYAVVVGISDYQDEGIPDLRFADKDALAFAGFLQSPAGGSLDEDHLKILLNEQATMAQFAIALDWLMEKIGENDQAIIYFSGHGDVEKRTLTQPGFLLCWDAPPKVYMAGGAFSLPFLQEVISTLSVQNKAKVLVVTDACRSGKLAGSSVGGARITGSNLAKQYANETKILSCQPDEYSLEGEQWGGGRGAFSYHLLDGLYGMADGNGDLKVNLLEIGRYLEDNVSAEVAPQSQIPMTIGSRGEKLTDVFPDILEKLKKNKAKGLQMFTATESRGIEDDVLAAADSNIVEMYLAFKKSLTDKQFLEPATACADFYFEKLSQEPQLEKLHSSMRRNYAAALQDDAQQVMNVMLKTGLTQEVTKSRKAAEIFKNYPIYLERAAELLGKEHYMYSVLQARRYYFEGKIKEERPLKRSLFKKALELQPEMPHATIQLIRNSEKEQQDSALYYFEKATTALPNWTEPYIALSNYYVYKTEDKDKGIELLERALEVDSSSVFAQYQKAKAYEYFKEYDSAEKWYLKTIESTGKDICFPCALNDLGTMYFFQRKFEKAEKYMLEAYHADTTFLLPLIGLSGVYGTLGQLEKAEKTLLKILKADTTIYQVFNNMGIICQVTGRYEEALSYYSKALSLSPRDVNTIYSIASMYRELGNINEEENYLLKGFAIDSNHLYINNGLGLLENSRKNFKKAEYYFSKVLQLDSTNGPALVNLADLWSTTKSYERAKEAYEKVLTLSFRVAYPYAHRGLGAYFLRQKDYEKALFNTKKALEYNPKLPRTHILLGQVYLHLDSLDEAKIAFDQAALLTPDDPEIDLCRAMYEVNNEQPRKAWKNLRKALKKGYDNYDDLTLEELLAPLKKKHKKWNNLMQKYFPNQPKK